MAHLYPRRSWYPLLVLCLLAGGGRVGLWAQPAPDRGAENREFKVVDASDNAILGSALDRLRRSDLSGTATYITHQLGSQLHDRPPGDALVLRLNVLWAEVLERSEANEAALTLLQTLTPAALKAGDREAAAQAYLIAARVYEKLGMAADTRRALDESRGLIEQYGLPAVAPHYHTREASYYRVLANSRDSVHFHANRARETALERGNAHRYAEGSLILGLAAMRANPRNAIAYFEQAERAYLVSNDQLSQVCVMMNQVRCHLLAGQPDRAMAVSDSALVVFAALQREQINDPWLPGALEINRAQALEGVGRYEEAYARMDRGRKLEQAFLHDQQLVEVERLQAGIRSAEQTTTIQQQQQRLQTEKNWVWALSLAVALGVILLVIVIWQYYWIRRANEELATAYAHEVNLRGEVHHRVKNNLQIIVSLLEIQDEEIDDPLASEQLDKLKERIYSMSVLHEMLYQYDESGSESLVGYLEQLLGHVRKLAGADRSLLYELNIPPASFSLHHLVPLGIILHELGMNSLKYATGPIGGLKIRVDLHRTAGGWQLTYADNGPGYPAGALVEAQGSLGTFLVSRMVAQLKGTCRTFNNEGATVEIAFPAGRPSYRAADRPLRREPSKAAAAL